MKGARGGQATAGRPPGPSGTAALRASSATLLLAGAAAWAATTAGTAGRPAPASSPPVATVGSLDIPRAEFEERARQALSDYRNRSGTEIPPEIQPVVRRQILERLIQGRLLVLEAKRQGSMPGDREAEDALRRDPFFNPGGVFDESRFQTVKSTQPVQFQAALEQARQGLAVRKLTDAVASRHRPDERELRARAMHGLERASFEYLALRRLDFNGAYPEPRESDILSDYAAHAAELRRPDRAVLSVLTIKQELSDSVTRSPERLSAWERGLERRAPRRPRLSLK